MDLSPLKEFLPPKTLPLFEAWLTPHPFRIVVTRPRRSKLGDFRSSPYEDRPTITVNGDLESHQFALTLTHEIAHLMTFEKYGHRIRAHGPEWKSSALPGGDWGREQSELRDTDRSGKVSEKIAAGMRRS